jgi:hypothetical protein
MPKAAVSQAEFIALFESLGGAATAKTLKQNVRSVHYRRRAIEARIGRELVPPSVVLAEKGHSGSARHHLKIKDGVVIIGSDAHYWPGIITTAHAGLVKFCEDMKPTAVVMNGDCVDGAKLSSHPPIGWEYRPEFADELEAVGLRLGEIEAAAPDAEKVWPAGNHDLRFESRIARVLPELALVKGVHLKDHFPEWAPCWGCWINHQVVIKHRFKGGLHAAFNNTLWSGLSVVTGHLHKGIVYPFTDYNGTRYGVDMPWMGENFGPQTVDYTEDSSVNWRSGFAVLTFIDSVLCQPELAFAVDTGVIEFRGQRIKV